MGGFEWSLLTILGPILLFAAILYATLRNRKPSRGEVERTEAATHELYKEEDAAHSKRSDAHL